MFLIVYYKNHILHYCLNRVIQHSARLRILAMGNLDVTLVKGQNANLVRLPGRHANKIWGLEIGVTPRALSPPLPNVAVAHSSSQMVTRP